MLAEGPPASVVGGLWPSRQGLCWGGTPLAAPLPLGDWNYGYPKVGSLGQHGRRGPWRNRGLSWRCSFVLKIVPGPGCLPPPAPNSPPRHVLTYSQPRPQRSVPGNVTFPLPARGWAARPPPRAFLQEIHFCGLQGPCWCLRPDTAFPGRGESRSSDVIRCYEFIYLYIYIYNLLRFYEMAFAVDLTLLTQCLCRLPARGGGPPERGTFCTV